jgi:hypothetical protein
MPENTVYVGRGTKWGNPFKVGEITTIKKYPRYISLPIMSGLASPLTRREAVRLYRYLIDIPKEMDEPRLMFTAADAKAELAGKDLACWCSPDDACHADVLLELANS